MYTDDQLDSALRTLDPADRHVDALGPRAAADLEAILATDPASDPAAGGRVGTHSRARVRRATLVGAAAVVLAAAVIAVPTVMPSGDHGFAGWAAVPEPLPVEQRPREAESCRESYRDGPGGYAEHLDASTVAVAERRGNWVTVVLSGEDGFTATCVTDASAERSGGMIGVIGAFPVGVLGVRDVEPVSLGVGVVENEEVSMIVGDAGAEVEGVTYASETYGDVVATVSHERFALWLPGDELRDAHRDGVEVEVTYIDGERKTVRAGY